MNNKMIKETNLECALKIEKEPNKDLKEILNLYSKDCLSDFYSSMTNDIAKGTKSVLIEKLCDYLLDEKLINRIFNSLSTKEYNFLINIVDNNGVIQNDYIDYHDYIFVNYFGIVYNFNYNNKLYTVIPNEILDIIKNIDTSKYSNTALENDKIIDLANAMCNLYGAAPINLFIEACKKYYNISKVNLDCILFAERNNSIRCINYEDKHYIVKDEFTDEYNINNILKVIEDMEDILCNFDFKEIQYNNIIKHKSLYYYEENSATVAFADYLKKQGLDKEEINDLISVIIESFKINYNGAISSLNEILSEFKFVLNEDNYSEFMTYLGNVVDNIPLWGNKGWTNKEIILEKFNK